MPPESSLGQRRSVPSKPKAPKSSAARERASSTGAPRSTRGNDTLSMMRLCCKSRSFCSIYDKWPGRPVISSPSSSTRPARGDARPEITWNNVVLPHPEGPSRQAISPDSTSSVTSRSTSTSPNPCEIPCISSRAIAMSTFPNKVYVLGIVSPSFSRRGPKRSFANWGFAATQFRQRAKCRKTFPKTYTYIF
ncbi:Uncharacterised protein [Collinsella intestinalis]|nr:Uncharacterised protein [Collinsella intestinalis]